MDIHYLENIITPPSTPNLLYENKYEKNNSQIIYNKEKDIF